MSVTAGGGGYGDPRERPAEVVRRDVAEGWISRERAAEVYGVALDRDGALDRARTAELRGRLVSA